MEIRISASFHRQKRRNARKLFLIVVVEFVEAKYEARMKFTFLCCILNPKAM